MKPLRVVLFGPESTGKSTLAERLAARFSAPWSAEYVREYWDAHGGVITAADLEAIARGQVAGEDAAAERARADGARVVLHDTDLLTCTIWDDLLFPGVCPDWARAEAARRARATDLYLFCDTDLPWAPDPQRCFPDEAGRAMCRRVFLEKLEATGARWTRVWGEDFVGREARAAGAVELILNRCATR
ncbi:MAG: AAA family ATPase [Opitutaceae bacterium]|nr:AAA family ATPase [Opitutaceae bacterium]